MSELGHLPAPELPAPVGLALEAPLAPEPDELVLSFPLATQREIFTELTAAERAVVDGLLAGLSNDEIARRRGVSRFTVANQVAHVFAKLRVHSRLDLALLSRRAA